MTAKELKKALKGVPDDTEVVGLVEHAGYASISSASLGADVDEDGGKHTQFTIYLGRYLDDD